MELGFELIIFCFFLVIGFCQGSREIAKARKQQPNTDRCDNLLDYLTLKDIYNK
jgi:hypothetical protein|tara:strand:- start:502 stop:663 length:162 start_codon:yes stop_codon:yes gene_type:complete